MSLSGPVAPEPLAGGAGQVVQVHRVGILLAELVAQASGLFVIFAGDGLAEPGPELAGGPPGVGPRRGTLPTCREAPCERRRSGCKPAEKTA